MKLKKKTFWLFLCSYISVLLIPVLILTAVWGPRMQHSALAESQVHHRSALVQVAEQLDQQLKVIYSLPKRIFNHPRILSSAIMDNPVTRKAAQSDINEMLTGNTFIEFVMLYLREYDYFLSARAASFYFSDLAKYPGIYRLTFGDMPLHEMYELLENLDREQVKYYPTVSLTATTEQDMLLFFLPFPNAKQVTSTCIVGILVSQIDRAVKSITAGNATCLLLDAEGKLMYCSDREISAYIQENGTLLANPGEDVQTRVLAMDGTEYSVTSMASAQTGWQYISMVPTSIVLANVYTMQRNMTLLLLAVLLFSSITIFFAMRMNYVPLRRLASFATSHSESIEQKTNDFDQIQGLIERLYTQNRSLGIRLSNSSTQMRDMILARILYGSHPDVLRALSSARMLHLELGESKWQVLLAEYTVQQTLEDVATIAGEETELFVLLTEVPGQLVCIRHSVSQEAVPERLMNILKEAQYVVASELTDALENLNILYSSTCAAMDYLHFSDAAGKVLYCSSLQDRFYNPRFYPLEVMQALESAITHGNLAQMNELIRQVEALLVVEGAPPYYIRSIYYNTISLLINGLSSIHPEAEELIMELTTRSILPRYTIREMIGILRSAAQSLSTAMQDKAETESPWITELAYIDQRLSAPDFCLQEMADKVGMAASTFSRTFKDSVGKNFKEYVDDLRIERARELLAGTDMPIEEVAVQTGYENITSFYRFFKKKTGIAPGAYRTVCRNDGKNSE